jgi:GT2 family glycosyltransferase
MSIRPPARGEPEVSVVMVARGAWQMTRRAIAALSEHASRPFELIVVDNASPDETLTELERMAAVRLLRNDHNRGFGPAVNQGAELARGTYLLLLNTDAFVHEGWLEPLIAALARPGVGAVVPRCLHPDGSLQEAGALLARDGTVHLYGDGDDPQLPWYRFRRTIDYGSAVCMLMRTAEFRAAGGFDERYAPAYYEDADLCMRLADRRLSVVYEPDSVVTHVRYGSGGLDAAAELSERNRRLFAQRWASALLGRPPTLAGTSEQWITAARDAPATPRVLLCSRERAASELARALIEGWPRGRLTWVTPRLHERADGWHERGVELIDRDDPSWLGGRLFHYDLVVGECEPALAGTIARTQPQAARFTVDELMSGGSEGLRSALARAGIAPG